MLGYVDTPTSACETTLTIIRVTVPVCIGDLFDLLEVEGSHPSVHKIRPTATWVWLGVGKETLSSDRNVWNLRHWMIERNSLSLADESSNDSIIKACANI